MTPAEIARLRELLAAEKPGPWKVHPRKPTILALAAVEALPKLLDRVTELERIESSHDAIAQRQRDYETSLRRAGFGRHGEPNTVYGMVHHCLRQWGERGKERDQLRTENAKLRHALEEIAANTEPALDPNYPMGDEEAQRLDMVLLLGIAHAALAASPESGEGS